jgi:ATP-dependent exoDNAse (exonuclease V) alpha subunit
MEYSTEDTCIEELLNACPENLKFNISNEIDKLNNPLYKGYNFKDKIEMYMIDLQYVESFPGRQIVLMTSIGRGVKKMGGHFKYLERQKQDNQDITNKSNLEIQLFETTIKQNEHLYKTRNWNYIVSGVAIVISIVALFNDCKGETPVVKEIEIPATK